jgi:hypothetical protein
MTVPERTFSAATKTIDCHGLVSNKSLAQFKTDI